MIKQPLKDKTQDQPPKEDPLKRVIFWKKALDLAEDQKSKLA